jgi:hypothetical protein
MNAPLPLRLMVRAFSLTSDSLGYFLGYALVHAPSVAVVSPWMSDVDLRLPLTDRTEERRLLLSEAVKLLNGTEVQIIVRSGEQHNRYLRNQLPDWTEFIELSDLHAKTIVTPEFVYLGSANITRGGLEINRELCEIIENEYDAVDAYLREELDLDI